MTAAPPLPLTRRAIAAFSRYREANGNRAAVVQQCGLVAAETEALDRLAANLAAVSETPDWWTRPESAGLLEGLAVEASLLPVLARSVAPPLIGAREGLEAVLRSLCGAPAMSETKRDKLPPVRERLRPLIDDGTINLYGSWDAELLGRVVARIGSTPCTIRQTLIQMRQATRNRDVLPAPDIPSQAREPPPRRVTEGVVVELTERDLSPQNLIPSQTKRDIAAAVGTTEKTVGNLIHHLKQRSKRMAQPSALEIHDPSRNGATEHQGPIPRHGTLRERLKTLLRERELPLTVQFTGPMLEEFGRELGTTAISVRSGIRVLRERAGVTQRRETVKPRETAPHDSWQALRATVLDCGLRAVEPPELREALRALLG